MTLEHRKPVYVVLAVFRPDPAHLAEQIESLAGQSYPVQKVVAVIADRASATLLSNECARFGLDHEIVVPDAETESYRSFEIGLRQALDVAPDTAIFALCDQDDVWHEDKLRLSVAAMAGPAAVMTHSDAEIVDENGQTIHRSLHRMERRKRNADVCDLLVENTVTGMTTLIDRRVAKAALPFPAQAGLFYHHDLWLALVASVLGDLLFLPQKLVKYRQHSSNVVGAVTRRADAPSLGSDAWLRGWACRYGVAAYLAKSLYLRVTELVASGDHGDIDRAALSELAPFLAPRATGVALMRRSAVLSIGGHGRLARDTLMLGAVQTGRMVLALRAVLRSGTMAELGSFDRKLFAAAPGVQPGRTPEFEADPAPEEMWSAEQFEDRRTVRRFDVAFSQFVRPRVVIMVPTLNPPEIFAGIATALDIGVGLAERGHDILFLATDLPIADRERSLAFIRKRTNGSLKASAGAIELACGRRDDQIAFSAGDRFLATAWWTAHLARDFLADYPFAARRFHYLLQDYEPGFYAWGAEYAGARASYDFDFIPIYNCSSLREHFHALGHGGRLEEALTFRPSIDIDRYTAVRRQRNDVPKLAVYGRPNVARNLFPVCISSLERFLNRTAIRPDEIDLVSVGQAHPDVRFNSGHRLRSLGKIPWDDYPNFLGSVDIGLSLMHSPHPSHPPLEMAAAGARVVTNDYGAKSLGAVSPAIHSVAPNVDAVAAALSQVWEAGPVSRRDRRVDMEALGAPLSEVVETLSAQLWEQATPLARAS